MAAARVLTIGDGVAEAAIAPDLGAGLASYDLVSAGERTALFRPCRDLSRAEPFDLANNLLIPWSNRISGGGFRFAGEFHRLDPNIPGEPCPIHGNGFSSPWSVERSAPDSAQFSLRSTGPGPFRYEAHVAYAVTDGALTMQLYVRNLGAAPLPFGLGFHPWIVRSPETQLQAKAARVMLETSDHLPAGEAPVGSRLEWNFAAPRPLPATWINNAFLGWNGSAAVLWPDRKLALDIAADPPLSTYIVYSPGAAADFFCFEPVTHPVDAHNLPGGPLANGLIALSQHPRSSCPPSPCGRLCNPNQRRGLREPRGHS